ncbi:GYF domain-containing protein, partial [Xanthomonas phaseoli]
MTQWYYADAQRQRQGPVDTDTLRARLSQGIIDRSSLVWREGLAQWVALHEVEGELGFDSATASAAPEASGPMSADAASHAPLSAASPGDNVPATASPTAPLPTDDHAAATSRWPPSAADGGIAGTSASTSTRDAGAADGADHHAAIAPLHRPQDPSPSLDTSAWSTTPLAADPSPTTTSTTTSPPYSIPAAATAPAASAWDAPALAAPAA